MYRMNNPSTTAKNPSTLKVGGGTKIQPSKLEPKNPSKLDPIIDNRNNNSKYSLSNERMDNEDKEILTKIQNDPMLEIEMILSDYENYSRITGYIFEDSQRKVLRNQSKIRGSHKWELMKTSVRNWKQNPFSRKEMDSCSNPND